MARYRLRPLRRALQAALLLVFLFGALLLSVLAFPHPAFPYRAKHKNFEVYSDRPIHPNIYRVLDDSERRLRTSELYRDSHRYRIFFCHDSWKLWLWGQNFSDQMGGATDNWLTRNVYLRESDIAENRVIAPGGVPLADADVRPLSYFIAHEATHAMQSRQFGRLMVLRYPHWLIEGYADHVAKGGQFDFRENLELLKNGSPMLDPVASGLYRRYHLQVVYLLSGGRDVRGLFADPPAEEHVLAGLRRLTSARAN